MFVCLKFSFTPAGPVLRHLAASVLLCAVCLLGPAFPAQAFEDAESAPVRTVPVHLGLELMQLGIANNMCAVTFDDGPSRYTPQLLDTLAEYQVPATFFVVGANVERYPETIRRILAEGHEVGNHSYSHVALRKQSLADQQADLRKLDTLLRELGADPRLVRPPFGCYDHNTVNVVQEMDGHIVMWTTDSQDWRKNFEIEDVLANMQSLYLGAPLRGVFLFHDTHYPTVRHMPEILDALLEAGCRFVTLSEYLDAPRYSPEVSSPTLEAHQDASYKVNFRLDGRLGAVPQ